MASTALSVLSILSLVAGYSFDITAPPTQCGQLSLQITHGNGDGKPPYTALIVPYGATPGNVEQRKVFQQQFSTDTTNFTLPYPANSNFVIMVSDSNGIGTGGTSVPTSVQSGSNDTSCLPKSVSTDFSFQIIPQTAINQCSPVVLAWSSSAQDPVNIDLLIPGGQSQAIPITNVGPQQGSTMGFSWTPNIRALTNIVLVAGDKRGPGTGGSTALVVGFNPNSDSSCIDNSSPSSTAGTPAGAVQTGANQGGGGSNNNGNGGDNTDIGAIVGGVVGGIVGALLVLLIVWFIARRRRQRKHPVAHGVDLLPEEGRRDTEGPVEGPQVEPFIMPPSSYGGDDDQRTGRPSMSEAGGRRFSDFSTTEPSESAYLASSSQAPTSSRKGAAPPQMRPVNFVQHEDAGEVPEQSGSGPETIELPPSYTSVRR